MDYRHVLLTRFGEPAEAFQIVEDALPEPSVGEVRIKVLATGVAHADVMMRRGSYPGMPALPFTPGYDVVGIIDAVGAGVSKLAPGQMVTALTVFGGYSQYICLLARNLLVVPEGVDPIEASCLPLNYLTAYRLLHDIARVKAGQRILVYAAAGGVGTALLQLGKVAGLQVYGVASTSKQEIVEQSGGVPIDYRQEDVVARVHALTGDGVDVAFDAVGGVHLDEAVRTLRRGGRLVSYGFSALPLDIPFTSALLRFIVPHLLRLALWSLLPNGRRVSLYTLSTRVARGRQPEWIRRNLSLLLDLLAQGKIAPVIAQRLPLEKVAFAHELLEHGQVQGKLVLLPDA